MDRLATFIDRLSFGLYEIRSLAAQEAAISWAEKSFYASLAATVVSAFALIGLLVSLQYTRKALKNSWRIGQAEIRAYVAPAINEKTIVIDYDDRELPFVSFNVSNFGQTPALNFRYAAFFSMKDKSFPQEGDGIKPIAQGPVPYTPLISGNPVIVKLSLSGDCLSDFQTMLRLEETTKAAFIMGLLQYEDVFGESHETAFCYQMHAKPLEGGRPGAYTGWTMTPRYNFMR